MSTEVDELKEKMHGMLDSVFKAAEGIVETFNHINGLFPEEEKKVADLKLVKSEKDKD